MPGLKNKIKDLSYTMLESVTGGSGVSREINGARVRFPVRYARYYEADYETATFEFLRRNCRLGTTFLDCGAHIGLFAVVGAQLVGETGKVFSFEPTPNTREVLEEVVRLNDCQQIVEVRAEAISKESGTATFFDTGDQVSNANSLVRTQRHEAGLSVPTVSIDDFVAERNLKVGVIKIDVEGAELDALRGAFETLRTQRPPLSLGLHPDAMKQAGATLEEVWEILARLDLKVFYEERLIERDWFISRENIFDVQCYAPEA